MTKPVILIPGRIHQRVETRLAETCELIKVASADAPELDAETLARVRGAAVSGRFPASLMAVLPNLEIIGSFGVGYDGVDVAEAARRGVIVTHTPDVLNDEVADTAVALLLNTVRRFPQAEAYLRAGRWEREGAFPLSPLSLKGRRVGIHGLGRIGLEIAARLLPFKVEIHYFSRHKRDGVPYVYHESLKALATAVDTLISIVPSTPETVGAIDAEILKALGPTGVLINVGRGATVNEDDLVAALKDGTIAAAGLDVYADEPRVSAGLLELQNTSLLPHVGSGSVATRDAMADLVVDNLLTWFAKGEPLTPVPETPLRR